jgi:hypothetical protein
LSWTVSTATTKPGFPICRFLNDNHAAVRRIQQASGGRGRAAVLGLDADDRRADVAFQHARAGGQADERRGQQHGCAGHGSQNVLGLSAASDLLVTVTVSALVDAYGPERAGASRPTRGRPREPPDSASASILSNGRKAWTKAAFSEKPSRKPNCDNLRRGSFT